MAGRLLRRAGVVLALLAVVVLAAWLAFSIYSNRRLARASERFEEVLGAPDLGRFMRPELPQKENAATWLTAGAGAVVLSEDEAETLRRLMRSGDVWSEQEATAVEQLLAANRPALALLERAQLCPESSYGIDYSRGPEAELPELIELVRAGRLLWAEARAALAAGDRERVGTAVATLERLSESLAGESLLIGSLVVSALDRYGLDLVHRVVTATEPDPSLLEAVAATVGGHDRRQMLKRALAAEGSMTASTSLELLLAGQEGTPLSRLEALLGGPAHRLLVAGGLEDYTRIGAMADRPYAEVTMAHEEAARGPFSRVLAGILYPNLIDAVGKIKSVESVSALAREAIRLRRHRLATGAWPEALEPLGRDPYSGGAVTVERHPDGALVLEAEGALELWRQRNPHEPFPGEPQFVWVLPPAP